MILAVSILLASSGGDCRYDRAAMLALDQRAFDQDMTGGWRAVANRGCDGEAADLIRDWRAAKRSKDELLYWHEGQLRANAGQYPAAIALFEKSRKPTAQDAAWGWNLYVDGSIAFLRGDRPTLKAARTKLASLPMPPGLAQAKRPDGTPATVRWPLNLNVLDGFLSCWGQAYKKAYACAKPMFRYSTKP